MAKDTEFSQLVKMNDVNGAYSLIMDTMNVVANKYFKPLGKNGHSATHSTQLLRVEEKSLYKQVHQHGVAVRGLAATPALVFKAWLFFKKQVVLQRKLKFAVSAGRLAAKEAQEQELNVMVIVQLSGRSADSSLVLGWAPRNGTTVHFPRRIQPFLPVYIALWHVTTLTRWIGWGDALQCIPQTVYG